ADVAEAESKPVKAPDENGDWKVYYRVADENVLASSLHAKLLKRSTAETDTMIKFTDNESSLLEYLDNHGGITVGGYMKMCRLTRMAAEASLVKLYDMGMVSIRYHNGECIVVAKE
ncbi:MAG: hypothetical protein IK092_03460, partial [Muribaculaceae bacterium]|nr:hypothetical protein [Muribaculaceae bacterium]